MPDAKKYANIILPLALRDIYTYEIPQEFRSINLKGKRVVVQFGARRYYAAIVKEVHDVPPSAYQTKEILSLLDEVPLLNQVHVDFWEWMAGYYMCTTGEIYKAAVPVGLKLDSETRVWLNNSLAEEIALDEKENLLVAYISSKDVVTIREISSFTDLKNPLPVLKTLSEKGVIILEEYLKRGYKPKTETMVSLSPEFQKEEKIVEALDKLKKAPKQLQLVMAYVSRSDFNVLNDIPMARKQLLEEAGSSPSSLQSLIKKSIFKTTDIEVSRFPDKVSHNKEQSDLNPHQLEAMEKILKLHLEKEVVLLHGVTSSGKTEIYIKLIDEVLKKGKQVLYLLPEIALTTQIIVRLSRVFGDRVSIYHSKFSDSERVEVWKRITESNRGRLVVGVRSSVFLPFQNLGLVIVDEEHENTYKQFHPAPRYHARDAAIYLARLFGAKVLLGTATPSFESYFNALTGKYGLVNLNHRYLDIEMPEIIVANTREARRRKKMISLLTPELYREIENALNKKEQIILFQNRRGFAPYLECELCSWVPYCKNCDVSLTYHKYQNQLVCHYCGFTYQLVQTCLACGNPSVKTRGFGTEKIEDEIALLFPNASITRMDLDSTRSKKSYERIINDFEDGNVDILIGTQMVTKGLDFNNVSVVGILNADNMLNYPDFRAFERSYQLMAQVSGRAGRKYKQGKVIIQSSQPNHQVIQDVITGNYQHLLESQLSERKKFRYPPYFRIIEITLKHKKEHRVEYAANHMAKELRGIFGSRVLGPETPMINRVQTWYLKGIMLKFERDKSFAKAKKLINDVIVQMHTMDKFKSLVVIPDVDPM